jgi:enamine deaminase RidA (YjgF/YER057c/UK114 family)
MARKIIKLESVHSTEGVGYSHAAKAGNTVYIAGQIALDADGNLVGKGDIEAQTLQVYANLQAILEELGSGLDDIVKMTTYLTNRSQLEAFRRVRDRFSATRSLQIRCCSSAVSLSRTTWSKSKP